MQSLKTILSLLKDKKKNFTDTYASNTGNQFSGLSKDIIKNCYKLPSISRPTKDTEMKLNNLH